MVEIKYNKKIINGRYHWTFTEGTVGGETWEFMDRLSKKQFLQAVERHIITAHPAVAYSLQGAGYYAQKVK